MPMFHSSRWRLREGGMRRRALAAQAAEVGPRVTMRLP